jgi:hypothetical protein
MKGATTFNSPDLLLNNLGELYYFVFDATGRFVHQKKQLKGDPSFGQISDELKVGQYTIVLLSCTGSITVGTTITTLAATKIMSTPASGDIFYKKLAVTVTAQGISESVLLDRVVGCVQIRVMDRISDNIAKVEFQIENETPYFGINTGEVEVGNLESRSVSADLNDSNRGSLTLGLLIMNNQAPITANLKFFDASNNMITAKRIPGIVNIRGTKVSVEGRLSEFMSAGFTVSYNDTWPSDSTIVYF